MLLGKFPTHSRRPFQPALLGTRGVYRNRRHPCVGRHEQVADDSGVCLRGRAIAGPLSDAIRPHVYGGSATLFVRNFSDLSSHRSTPRPPASAHCRDDGRVLRLFPGDRFRDVRLVVRLLLKLSGVSARVH